VLVIQISTYPDSTREQKEAFVKAIASAEILKDKLQHVVITCDEGHNEN